MEDPIDESDGRRFVRVLIWKLNMHLPSTPTERRCRAVSRIYIMSSKGMRTLVGSLETNVEFRPEAHVSTIAIVTIWKDIHCKK